LSLKCEDDDWRLGRHFGRKAFSHEFDTFKSCYTTFSSFFKKTPVASKAKIHSVFALILKTPYYF
jgi:hypothetical protein